MRVFVFDTPLEAAKAMADQIREGTPKLGVLGVATGKSPLAVYKYLNGFAKDLELTGFALDEYVGVGAGQTNSFAHYVSTKIEEPLGFRRGAIRVPNGLAVDPEVEAEEFEAAIADTHVSIQILGVGRNGHIGFNEPGSPADSLTRVVTLSEETRSDNRDDFGGPVPATAITQGVATIMRAEQICLIATGESKAVAIAKLLSGDAESRFPVSILTGHPGLTVYLDQKAFSLSE